MDEYLLTASFAYLLPDSQAALILDKLLLYVLQCILLAYKGTYSQVAHIQKHTPTNKSKSKKKFLKETLHGTV